MPAPFIFLFPGAGLDAGYRGQRDIRWIRGEPRVGSSAVPFACLIIRIFQFIFSVGTAFFSHNKSANSTFSHDFSAKRTGSVLFSNFLFALLKSQAEKYLWLICCERKTLLLR
jgi:hypothetical protein